MPSPSFFHNNLIDSSDWDFSKCQVIHESTHCACMELLWSVTAHFITGIDGRGNALSLLPTGEGDTKAEALFFFFLNLHQKNKNKWRTHINISDKRTFLVCITLTLPSEATWVFYLFVCFFVCLFICCGSGLFMMQHSAASSSAHCSTRCHPDPSHTNVVLAESKERGIWHSV